MESEKEEKRDFFSSNLSYLLDKTMEERKEEIKKEKKSTSTSSIQNLVFFTTYSFFDRIIHLISIPSLIHYKIIWKDHSFALYHEKHWYPFSFLSNYVKSPLDKKNLRNCEKRMNNFLTRLIRIASSLLLEEANLLLTYEKDPWEKEEYQLCYLIEYQKEGKTKIINYIHNLIMEKDDYFSLFDVHVLGKIPQYMLYQIYDNVAFENYKNHLLFSVLFQEEIQKDFHKKNLNLMRKYNESGIHNASYQELFFQRLFESEEDMTTREGLESNEILFFTLQPSVIPRHIKVLEDGTYCYRRKYHFTLLSDHLPEKAKEFQEILQSEDRLHYCHHNAVTMACAFEEENPLIVFGMLPLNEKETLHHGWVELKNKVIDFNLNIIMKKEEYYEMCHPIILQKTSIEEYAKNYRLLLKTLGLELEPFIMNSVGTELRKDFMKRNAFLINNKK